MALANSGTRTQLEPLRWLLTLGAASLLAAQTPAALRLAARYDSMDVEHHWLAGHHINWLTGIPDNGKPAKTHCSAFVAAACDRLGIYLLHPPEHSTKNLANAQFRWLVEHGQDQGWKPIASPIEAQHLANEGKVVAAVFLNPNPLKSGHIALVRPSDKPDSLIALEGPQIVQAGKFNYASTSVKTGFSQHPGAWINATDNRLRFYAHDVFVQ